MKIKNKSHTGQQWPHATERLTPSASAILQPHENLGPLSISLFKLSQLKAKS